MATLKAILGTFLQCMAVVGPVWQSSGYVSSVLASRAPVDVFAYVVVVAALIKEAGRQSDRRWRLRS